MLVVVGGGVPVPLRAIVTVPGARGELELRRRGARRARREVDITGSPIGGRRDARAWLPDAVNCIAPVPVMVAAPIAHGEPVLVTGKANDRFVAHRDGAEVVARRRDRQRAVDAVPVPKTATVAAPAQ